MKNFVFAATALLALTETVTSPALAASPGIWLESTMNGNSEHGGGDDDGWATFSAHVNVPAGQICYTLDQGNIDNPTSAEIRRRSNGDWGWSQSVMNLSIADGNEGCISADASLLQDMIENSDNYIVQIDSNRFDHGAVRGSLAVQSGNLNPQGDDEVDQDAARDAQPVG